MKSTRRASGIAILVLLVSTVAACGGDPQQQVSSSGPASQAQSADPLVSPEYQDLLQPSPGDEPAISQEEAFPDGGLSNVLDQDEVRAKLAPAADGDVLGMAWLTTETGPAQKLIVQAVADTEGLARLQAAAEEIAPGRIQVVAGKYTLTQLKRYKDDLSDIVRRDTVAAGLGLKGYGGSVESVPVVRVLAPPAKVNDAFVKQLLEVVPRDALEVVVSPKGEPTVFSTSRDLYPPVKAGHILRFDPYTSSDRCTEGFTYVNGLGYFGSSAAHCTEGYTGVDVKMGTNTGMDYVRLNKLVIGGDTFADVLTFSISANNLQYSRGVLISNGVTTPVESRYNGNRFVNDNSCMVGYGQYPAGGTTYSDQRCVTISQTNVDIPYSDFNTVFKDQDCTNSFIPFGWSGGPVYVHISGYLKASGIISSGFDQLSCWNTINYPVYILGSEIAFA